MEVINKFLYFFNSYEVKFEMSETWHLKVKFMTIYGNECTDLKFETIRI